MAKRSDFERRPQDKYLTIDKKAVQILMPHLKVMGVANFFEPCAGEMHLVKDIPLNCVGMNDISWPGGEDALTMKLPPTDAIITNPPWTRQLLHPMILRFSRHAPTWLLFDSDWMFNQHAAEYLNHCSHIVAVGRLKWIEGTTHCGKDNCAWYRFWHRHEGGPRFYGRRMKDNGEYGRKTIRADRALRRVA